MIRFKNYLQIRESNNYEDEKEGEILPCPLCGRIPSVTLQHDYGKMGFATISCFGGSGISHAYIKVTGLVSSDLVQEAAEKWNLGRIDYFERLPNVFRSCFSCKKYIRKPGELGECAAGRTERPRRGCKEDYEKLDESSFRSILTR